MNTVFLGGTCASTTWRDDLISKIDKRKMSYIDPRVSGGWTESGRNIEELQKKYYCNVHLYVLTSEMRGVYSIAEAVQSSNDKSKITIVNVIPDGFDKFELESLSATLELIRNNGGLTSMTADMSDVAEVLKIM